MISAVAEMYGIHPQTLRLYEREGLLKPSRTEGNTRLYTDEDVERLEFILNLARDLGVNIAGIGIILQMRERMEEMNRQMQSFVEYVRSEMLTRFQQGAPSFRRGDRSIAQAHGRANPQFDETGFVAERPFLPKFALQSKMTARSSRFGILTGILSPACRTLSSDWLYSGFLLQRFLPAWCWPRCRAIFANGVLPWPTFANVLASLHP